MISVIRLTATRILIIMDKQCEILKYLSVAFNCKSGLTDLSNVLYFIASLIIIVMTMITITITIIISRLINSLMGVYFFPGSLPCLVASVI